MPAPRIEAAGGVLWRAGADGVEVALVHRPKYDDWSLPKGKLEDGEDPLAAAVREVHEETGSTVVAGPLVGTSRYSVHQDGTAVPKRVTWWSVQHTEGVFVASHEVDALRWCRPEEAELLLSAGRDLSPLRSALSLVGATTVLLVRHGSAGSRSRWPGADGERPLDDRGAAQAQALATQLAPYVPKRVVSAPPARCRQTVQPLAQAFGVELGLEPLLGDDGFSGGRSLERLHELASATAGTPGALVVCSQGGAVPGLVEALDRAPGAPTIKDARLRKAATWVLCVRDGVLLTADRRPPPRPG